MIKQNGVNYMNKLPYEAPEFVLRRLIADVMIATALASGDDNNLDFSDLLSDFQ